MKKNSKEKSLSNNLSDKYNVLGKNRLSMNSLLKNKLSIFAFNFLFVLLILIILLSSTVKAQLVLDNIFFDPSVISAGDEVDIVVQFHDTNLPIKEEKISDPSYTFKVKLMPDDDVSNNYLLILDSAGDDYNGATIFKGDRFNKVFRIKVKTNAPPANYQLKLIGQWYKNNKPISSQEEIKFFLPVKKEGIIMNVANIVTTPTEVRPGDDYVILNTYLENAGHKDAKSVLFELSMPKGFKAPYSNNNRIWAGYLAAGSTKAITNYFNVDDNLKPGIYNFSAKITYMDTDDNSYTKELSLPILIREKPVLKVEKSELKLRAGDKGLLKVYVKNKGTELAENVDVRLIKANDQPFDLDARSDFIGTIKPGETKIAVFPITARNSAPEKEHTFTILIRATGDSNIGDNNIYTFSDYASLTVKGKKPNYLLYVGVVVLILLILLIIINYFRKK